MFNLVYNSSLLIHNCSPHIHFGSENRHEKDSQANIRCHVVRLCTLMSYDYRCSCRTFIATHVVRHDNLIKTTLKYSCLSLFKYTKNLGSFLGHIDFITPFSGLARLKPKSVIRPKQGIYQDIIDSFQLLSAFLSASCFHLRFDIARYAFNAGCRNLLETNANKI